MTRNRSILARLGVASVAAAALVMSGSVVGAAAAPTQIDVQEGDVATTRPADGGWFVDNEAGNGSHDGTFEVTKDGPNNDVAMKLGVYHNPGPGEGPPRDKVYLYNTFGPGERPTDIPALLQGASYDYAGVNVNFQLEVVFQPKDDQYGPPNPGEAPQSPECASAVDWGVSDDPDWCYTTLKWEPYVSPGVASWTHVDLSVDSAGNSSAKIGGWVAGKRIGSFEQNVSNGQLMSTFLNEMADYEVVSYVFGIGSGTPGPAFGYMKSYTIGGTTYGFAPTAAAPTASPAADTDELLQLIDDEGIDVEADTAAFGVGGGDLDELDVSEPLDGVYENWAGASDAFVDAYSFSAASYVGTFPVVGGDVVLTGLDLSALGAGTHHLLLIGQTTGTTSVVAFSVAAPAGDDEGSGDDEGDDEGSGTGDDEGSGTGDDEGSGAGDDEGSGTGDDAGSGAGDDEGSGTGSTTGADTDAEEMIPGLGVEPVSATAVALLLLALGGTVLIVRRRMTVSR